MDWIYFGTKVRDSILSFAKLITLDYWPGLISFGLVAVLVVLLLRIGGVTWERWRVLDKTANLVRDAGDAAGFQMRLHVIEKALHQSNSRSWRRLAATFTEFRETLIEPARDGDSHVRNSVRPSAFFNLDDLHFGLSGWRVWPGLFVSVGLFCTFLGLIAALAQTQTSLEVGGGDQVLMIAALEGLLKTASAKFTMSLTGLACSIVFTLAQRFFAARLENAVTTLAHELETRMSFVSLEALADQQLAAIKEQTKQQQLLNTQLIAELSKPLERMTATGAEAIGGMVSELGQSLTASLGQSIATIAERIDGAADKLVDLSSALSETSERFRATLERSSSNFDALVQRIESAAGQLATSADSMNSASTPVMETARSTAESARALAEGSKSLVDAAKIAVEAEKTVVVASARSIEELIRAFESRAKAYDGQLEKAFSDYVGQVQRTLGELRQHSDGVHDRYADALQTLQAVIENARTFVPESDPTLERLPT